MSKTDSQLKKDIDMELSWDPKINAAQIGVSVDKGAVSLRGVVDTYGEKWAAEDAVKRVNGVCAFAEELTVKVLDDDRHSDSEIAAAAQSAIKWDVFVPNTITAKVDQGMVTLDGQVSWNYERDSAERAIRNLAGVSAVINNVTLKPSASASQVKENVEAALQRQAKADGKAIGITTSGGKVTLTGQAPTWQSIDDASAAAWATPGVTDVDDRLTVSY